MKYPLIIVVYLLTCGVINAQNFIPNPDFSSYIDCPTGYSQLNNCKSWYQPTAGTSDYFNACAAPDVGVPQNIFGYQESASNAYIGFYSYAPTSYPADYKEYTGATFAPLTVGKKYTVSINISLADSSWYATDGFGIYFTTYKFESYSSSLAYTLKVTPQIDYSHYGIISDKINWTTLTGSFIADSAYTNLLIGNFKEYNIVNVNRLSDGAKDTSLILASAYYYVGLVYVDTSLDQSIHIADTFQYWFPSSFTPNNDGINDIFRLRYISGTDYKDYSLSIYNRFGQLVFFTRDKDAGWNGYFNNVPQDLGVYFYMAQFTINGNRELLKGDLTLVR